MFCILSFQAFAAGDIFRIDEKKVDVNVNAILLKIPTVNPTATPTVIPTKYMMNSPVGTIFYDSSRNFSKWISPINRRNKVATKTYAKSLLSTQINIKSDDSAISINTGKQRMMQLTTAPTAISTIGPTKSPTKRPRIAPTVMPTKITPAPSALSTVSPTKVIQPPTVAATIVPTKQSSSKPSVATGPTKSPTKRPGIAPTVMPTKITPAPSALSTVSPTKVIQPPTVAATIVPTKQSSSKPSVVPTRSMKPSTCRPTSGVPSKIPSKTAAPTRRSSYSPSKRPSRKPSNIIYPPTSKSSPTPSMVPSAGPSMSPVRPPSFNGNFQYHPFKKIMNGTVNLYNIYFGLFPRYNFLNASQQTQPLVDYFSSNIGSSSWYKTLTTYYQINNDGSKTYVSPSVKWKKSAVYQATTRARTIADDTVIPNMIVALINAQQLPVDLNGIYNVFFRGDFTYGSWLKSLPDGWCGFHSNFALTDGRILKYTAMGDPSTGPSDSQLYCEGIVGAPTANENIGADSMVNILAHEIAEVVTNDDKAWNDESLGSNGENGDICSWDFQLGETPNNTNWNIVVGQKKFLVQSMYQVDYGCVLSCYC